jgi:DNA topoisomerase VI subunit B
MKREMFYKYIPEVVTALHSLTGTSKGTLQKKLEKMVLNKLKLEEALDVKEAEENGEKKGEKEKGEENGKKEENKKATAKKS